MSRVWTFLLISNLEFLKCDLPEENIIQNRHLLNFNAGELQTVYYDENDLEGDFIKS